uniref:CARD domain-containing protein n=1 Tax=Pundamilia nyererei TaxID=303518 RepID=A0A3B4GXK7_9CICH
MACTSQSAEGYIRSARRHLVGGLKNLSVILENLYQQGVLCDEEVSKIQAEKDDYDKTRKILDSVTNKGEKACYEFLKIIYMTRKRTLERPPLHSAVEIMQRMPTKVNVCLRWDKETPACHNQCESLLKALPFISSLRYVAFAFKQL